MFITKRDGELEIFDIKKVKKSIKSAYLTVYSEIPKKSVPEHIASLASGACADFVKEGAKRDKTYTSVLLSSSVYQRLMDYDKEVAVAYILFSAAKHLVKDFGVQTTNRQIRNAFYNTKDGEGNE